MKSSVALLAAACAAGPVAGQALHPAAGASLVTARVRSDVSGSLDQFSGTAFLGEGTCTAGRLSLDVSYLQGSLDPTGATLGGQRDLVEGTVLLGVRPAAWLTLEAGPHARAYTLTGTTQRWLFWELRAHAATAFVGSAVLGYAELWRALGGAANVSGQFDHAQGGEVGMIVRLSRTPFEARVAYRIDHAVLGNPTRRETVDGVVAGIGWSSR
jgi:hypothetical protein